MRRFSFLLISFISFFGFSSAVSQAEFLGNPATGLLVLEKKDEYYLYVPPDYTTEKTWTLLVVLGERGNDPKQAIQPWIDWAKEHGLLVAAVPHLVPEHDLPEGADKWLLGVLHEIIERYRVDPAGVLLVGLGSGGHYAAYLGLKYPGEFSAAALAGEAWSGPYERLMRPSPRPESQISFYVALDPKGEAYPAAEQKALELEQKGYSIKFESLQSGQDLVEFREPMMQWFQENQEFRTAKSRQVQKGGMKKTFRKILRNVFQM